MYYTRVPTYLRIEPAAKGAVIGMVGANQSIPVVAGRVTERDNFRWHRVAGPGEMWIAERPTDQDDPDQVILQWKSVLEALDVPPGSIQIMELDEVIATRTVASADIFDRNPPPPPPAEFTHRAVLNAFQAAGRDLNQVGNVNSWLAQANLTGLSAEPDAIYQGVPISKLPLDAEVRAAIEKNL